VRDPLNYYRLYSTGPQTYWFLNSFKPQEAAIELRRETYPGKLNVTCTRGFVSSRAFVDLFTSAGPISQLLPSRVDDGLTFVPTHLRVETAPKWMGFEARHAILEVLDEAVADAEAQVRVVAYDLNEPDVVSRLERLRGRLKAIIDDSESHGEVDSAETQAEERLVASDGRDNVRRQHMGQLQHNKTIVVDGPKVQTVVCGSTNFSWRGFYVQSNNAMVLRGEHSVNPFVAAFEAYWQNDSVAGFGDTAPAELIDLELDGIGARVALSPHSPENALLKRIADDIGDRATSSLFYSLAFLHQTTGPIRDAIEEITRDDEIFVYGVSDSEVGLELQKPDGNVAPVSPAALGDDAPEPFMPEPAGGRGIRMDHKFVVIDFGKPTARDYLGSYNFSSAADTQNGEPCFSSATKGSRSPTWSRHCASSTTTISGWPRKMRRRPQGSSCSPPPQSADEEPWWAEEYTVAQKIRDRELFA